ncbi:MAG: transporter substrate-binding domain-containing protein [Pseudomonadota bacterium]|jgi:polar amino acid transport system substrate-binding protein|nr:transporter substrate-binding domain-containing protein [Pseudomonadota bacterium]
MYERIARRFITAAIIVLGLGASLAGAGPLSDRIESGKSIRIGFANEVPWAYPGEGGRPAGFVNAYVIGLLKHMGYEQVEPVVTDWGGLVPALMANRVDMVTGGLYILASRCRSIAFSEPIGRFGDAFIVAAGNPKGLATYADIRDRKAILATGAGYNTVEAARKEGVPDSQLMQVPGPTEILAAVRAGRADAGGGTWFTMLQLAEAAGGDVEVTDPAALPEWTLNYVGVGFRPADRDFLEKFNAAQREWLGSDEMLAAVAPYGYGPEQLPGDVTTEWACANR